jgi:hypothetical protein
MECQGSDLGEKENLWGLFRVTQKRGGHLGEEIQAVVQRRASTLCPSSSFGMESTVRVSHHSGRSNLTKNRATAIV